MPSFTRTPTLDSGPPQHSANFTPHDQYLLFEFSPPPPPFSSSRNYMHTYIQSQQQQKQQILPRMATTTSSSPPPWVRGKVIGRGSYGTVSLAFHRETGRVFAVKSVELGSSPDPIDSLDNEIRILSSLDCSPYIVQYLGDDVDGSHRNLHLELLPGGTVTDSAAARRLVGKNFSDEGIAKSHARCLVSALRHVHSGGIVHCDVKGRNVIVGHDPMVAKLADFGSAIRAGSRKEPRGSPLWMAPEVVRGEYQGPESDVWSLGCTVIEMVTGRPAWEDKGAYTLSKIGFSDELPEIPAELSAQGRDFLMKCLRRDPKERWSCDQLLRHPFVASDTPDESRIDWSPRCVLDWVSSDFEEDLELESDDESTFGTDAEPCARGRIAELCQGGGPASWESEGWVEVREAGDQLNSARDASCWEYADSEREALGTSSEYCGSSGAEGENSMMLPEYLNGSGGREQVEGKWRRSCQHGTGPVEEEEEPHYCYLAVGSVTGQTQRTGDEVVGIDTRCNNFLLLFLPYLLLLLVILKCDSKYCSKEGTKHFVSYYFTRVPFFLRGWLPFQDRKSTRREHELLLLNFEFAQPANLHRVSFRSWLFGCVWIFLRSWHAM
ncbi:hypothetical protein CDL15_Pgr010335 [Punica granatum]|uniref:Protein kinase domain-containing protein n=1 Tax=Punica granatum TaxID=22663 RepID=A0A218W1G8_PUNGR|nr:hypothetical protein CDL15_Pgr010335 [Punica granatum]